MSGIAFAGATEDPNSTSSAQESFNLQSSSTPGVIAVKDGGGGLVVKMASKTIVGEDVSLSESPNFSGSSSAAGAHSDSSNSTFVSHDHRKVTFSLQNGIEGEGDLPMDGLVGVCTEKESPLVTEGVCTEKESPLVTEGVGTEKECTLVIGGVGTEKECPLLTEGVGTEKECTLVIGGVGTEKESPLVTEGVGTEKESPLVTDGVGTEKESPLLIECVEIEKESPLVMESGGTEKESLLVMESVGTDKESSLVVEDVRSEKDISTLGGGVPVVVPMLEEDGEVRVAGEVGGGELKLHQQLAAVPGLSTEWEDRAVAYSLDRRFLKYDLEIGRGSFKTVYKGLDTETGVAIAWCELQENRYNKAEQLRFKDEVSILKTLQHPNILRLYETWEVIQRGEKKDRKVLILVTELMTSGTLKGYMRRLKEVKPKVIRSWGRQILRGLHFLHTRTPPIIHRDLKCDNIFINGTTGLVKIGDLGLATLKRSEVKTVIGTPEFMAPEMYEESYNESVDVYAFGMCLLEMCTQEYPYMECSNPAQIYKRVTQGVKPNALVKVKNSVLLYIIAKCTIVNKESRYNVKMLLSHEFFAEGVKIEALSCPGEKNEDSSILNLRMEVPTKETSKKNNQESIEFIYDIDKDQPDVVVGKMVKSNTLRADEQVKMNAIRSLRDYVDTVKQKRKQVQSKDREKDGGKGSLTPQLSSVTESYISDSDQISITRTAQLVSNSESCSQPGPEITMGGGGGEAVGGEGNEGPPVVPGIGGGGGPNGPQHSRPSPLDRIISKVEDSRQLTSVTSSTTTSTREMGSSSAQSRTHSECSMSSSTSCQPAPLLKEISGKSVAMPVVTNPAPGGVSGASGVGGGVEGNERHNYTVISSKLPKHKLPSTLALNAPSSQTPFCSDSSKTSRSAAIVSTAVVETIGLELVSEGCHQLAPSDNNNSMSALVPSEPVSSGHISSIGGLEASSSSSLMHDIPMADRERLPNSAPSGSERQISGGNGKKKGSRAKPKQLKLDFQELTNGVVKCTLNTSTGQVDFRFSIEYDKPLTIFKNIVKARHLTGQEEEDFLHQINQLLAKVKKKEPGGVASSIKSPPPTGSSCMDNKTHPSVAMSPEEVQTTKSLSTISSELPPPNISPTPPPPVPHEDMQRKPWQQQDETWLGIQGNKMDSAISIGTQGATVSPEEAMNIFSSTPEDAKKSSSDSPEEAKSSSVGSLEEATHPPSKRRTSADSFPDIAVSTAATSDLCIPLDVEAVITSANMSSTSAVCSIPAPSTAPVCSRPIKKFEVAEVAEPDSPPPSDLSAQSSMENVARDIGPYPSIQQHQQVEILCLAPALSSSSSQQLPISTSYNNSFSSTSIRLDLPAHPSGLESSSDSFIHAGLNGYTQGPLAPVGGTDLFASGSSYSCTPEPGLDYQHNLVNSYGQPYLPPRLPSSSCSFHAPQTAVGQVGSVPISYSHHHQPEPQCSSRPTMSRQQTVPSYMSSLAQQNNLAEQQQIQHHYHTTPALHDLYPSQHPSIRPDMYMPYQPQQQNTYTLSSNNNSSSTSTITPSQAHFSPAQPTHSNDTRSFSSLPHTSLQFPSFSDVPQADLLAKAFMVFLHAMGNVFRDPSFSPLLDTLDQQFGTGIATPSTMTQQPSHHTHLGMGRGGTFSPPQVDSQNGMMCEDKTRIPAPLKKPQSQDVAGGGISDEIEKELMKLDEEASRLDEEAKEVERRKIKLLEQYRQHKRSSESGSIDDDSVYLAIKKSSFESSFESMDALGSSLRKSKGAQGYNSFPHHPVPSHLSSSFFRHPEHWASSISPSEHGNTQLLPSQPLSSPTITASSPTITTSSSCRPTAARVGAGSDVDKWAEFSYPLVHGNSMARAGGDGYGEQFSYVEDHTCSGLPGLDPIRSKSSMSESSGTADYTHIVD